MKRVHRYTQVCFLLVVTFILGSMAGMNFIFQEKESRLLQESGTAEIESPVMIWQETEETGEEGTDTAAEQEKRQLTIEQIEEVIDYRADAATEILHGPAEGQIPMEDAIASGEDWLMEMGFAEENDSQVLSRRASLGVKMDQEISGMPMEPYYSFWTVQFSNESMYAVLSVNAVTGKVWDAEITLYNDLSTGFSWEKLELFLKLAGIQEDTENYIEVGEANPETGAMLRIKNNALCAEVKSRDIQVAVDYNGGSVSWGSDEKYRIKTEVAGELVEHNEDKSVRTQRIIAYRLISS